MLTFGPSTTTQAVTIDIHNDEDVEVLETFSVTINLTTSAAHVTLEPNMTEIRILDDDGGF